MNEEMIRDAEWSHLMHPADAKALEKLKSDNTLTILKVIAVIGCCIALASVCVSQLLF